MKVKNGIKQEQQEQKNNNMAIDIKKALDEAGVGGLRKRIAPNVLAPFTEYSTFIPDEFGNIITEPKPPEEEPEVNEASDASTEPAGGGTGGTQSNPEDNEDAKEDEVRGVKGPKVKTGSDGDKETQNTASNPPDDDEEEEEEECPDGDPMSFEIEFIDTGNNNGEIRVTPNNNFPVFRQGIGNVKAQGGGEGVKKNWRFNADAWGFCMSGVCVPGTGTPMCKYEGDLKEVTRGV